MDCKQKVRLLTLSAAVAALSACGGGGGGDASPTASPSPSPAPAPAPATETGLSAPTGTLQLSQSQAQTIVSKVNEAFQKGPGGFASVNLGAFREGIGTAASATQYNCPGGGTATFTPTGASSGTYSFSGCSINGVTYNGMAAVSFTMSGSTLTQYLVGESQLTAAVEGQNIALDEQLECNLVNQQWICVGRFGGNSWGNDFHWANGVANGTYQCECLADRWNNGFTDYGVNGGQVFTEAGAGTASIVYFPTPTPHFEVTITVNGQSQMFPIGG
jgi:hypothetical protein